MLNTKPVDKLFPIWSSFIDYEDWREDMEFEFPDATEDERIDMATEINDEYLEDERCNLDIELPRNIIIVADLGLWNGRVSGYKEISHNIKDCLTSDDDFITWFVDNNGDLRGEGHHHDGTNRYLYRTYRDNATDEDIQELKEKIYSGTATDDDVWRVTKRLGDAIADVYGWKL